MTIKLKIENPRLWAGYTLVEILVTLTIISLLFTFGYVSFRDFSRRQALINAASMIQGDLRLAQGDATTGQKPDDVSCSAPNTLNSYDFNVFSNAEYMIEANCSGSVTAIIVKDVNLPDGITISTPSPNPLIFKILSQGTNADVVPWVLTVTQAGTLSTTNVSVNSGGDIQ